MDHEAHTGRVQDPDGLIEWDGVDRTEREDRVDELARVRDPSLADHRERVAAKVRDRSGVAGVPAPVLLQAGAGRAAGAAIRGQERVNRAVRDGLVRGVRGTVQGATSAVRKLGPAWPTAPQTRDAHMLTREGL